MARKDKPYLPLYVQDFMTDERLMECSALATGVYIRIMCIMHKSEPYGTILLKQKDKQSGKQIENFCFKFAKHLPYDYDTILAGLNELIAENCLQIDGDLLKQKRMFEDGKLSLTRSNTGSLGGNATQEKAREFARAKVEANTDIDIESDIDNENTGIYKISSMVVPNMMKIWISKKNDYLPDKEADSHACLQIAYRIAEIEKISKFDAVIEKEKEILNEWGKIADFILSDNWFRKLTLDSISTPKMWQKVINAMATPSLNGKEKPTVNGLEAAREEYKKSQTK